MMYPFAARSGCLVRFVSALFARLRRCLEDTRLGVARAWCTRTVLLPVRLGNRVLIQGCRDQPAYCRIPRWDAHRVPKIVNPFDQLGFEHQMHERLFRRHGYQSNRINLSNAYRLYRLSHCEYN